MGQPRPQVGIMDQSALAAARSDPIPEAQFCPIKKRGCTPCQSEVGEACQAWEKNLAESARPLEGPGPDGQREAPIKRLGERPGAAG